MLKLDYTYRQVHGGISRPILDLSVLTWCKFHAESKYDKNLNFKIFILRKFVQIGLLSAVKLDRLDIQRQFVYKKMGFL